MREASCVACPFCYSPHAQALDPAVVVHDVKYLENVPPPNTFFICNTKTLTRKRGWLFFSLSIN